MGVTLLHARKPADAFDCLIETVQLHHRDPLIWLRLAECCIQVHKPVTFATILLFFFKVDLLILLRFLGKQKRLSAVGEAARNCSHECGFRPA